MNREQMIARMEAILAAAAAESNRALTTEEQTEFDGLLAQCDALDAQADTAATLAAQRAEVQARRTRTPAAAPAATAPALSRAGGQVPIRGAEVKDFSTLAEFCSTAIFNPNDQRLANLFRGRDGGVDVRGEQRMDQGQTGGFMIPVQFRDTILQVQGPSSIVRARATVIPAGDPPDAEIEMPALDQTGASPSNTYGGVAVSWLAEGGAKPETDADFRLVSLKPNEQAGHIVLTDKLLRNSAATGAFVASQLPLALAASEDSAFISGSGIGKPMGFINSPAAYLQARTTGSAVKYDDFANMVSRVLTLGGSPVWIINRALYAVITLLVDGDNRYIFNPSGANRAETPDTILGYPVIWSERSPAAYAKGDVCLVALNAYLIKDGSGPFIAYSEHVYFLSNKTVVKAFSNVDGKPWLTAPFKGQDDRTSSPFVVLAA